MTESNDTSENVQLATRVSKDLHTAFFDRADKHGMPASAILRELITGFVEGRVILSPPKHLSELYNITKE